ncbi:MAG: heavy-metal-associated protein [Verrucomicrobiales bacterium]|nr:heavy-metal-associated protein [Verrucomicrobiales bacterium]
MKKPAVPTFAFTTATALLATLLCSLQPTLAAPSAAAPASPPTAPAAAGSHVYRGEIAGVACAACSKKVKASLEKLPGVTSIKVIPTEQTGIAKLEIASTSPEITKAAAIKALGKSADAYTILTLEESKK